MKIVIPKANQLLSTIRFQFVHHKRRAVLVSIGIVLVTTLSVAGLTSYLLNDSGTSTDSPDGADGVSATAVQDAKIEEPTKQKNKQSTGNSNSNIASHSSPSSGTTPGQPPVSGFTAPIGYMGGSLTNNATDGYRTLGGTKFWDYGQYGGGTIDKLAMGISTGDENHKYWNVFNKLYEKSKSRGPTQVFWLQLLGRAEKSDEAYYNDAIAVINEITRRIPGITVYVSAMNDYNPAGICHLPAEAPPQMRRVAQLVVQNQKASAGPDVGVLTASQLEDSECHANDEGRRILGSNLSAFFGN